MAAVVPCLRRPCVDPHRRGEDVRPSWPAQRPITASSSGCEFRSADRAQIATERWSGPFRRVIGSFFRTPALLSFIGAIAVAAILWTIFLQGGEGISAGARLYALGGIVPLVGTRHLPHRE